MINKSDHNLSVVIATLGGESLQMTIDSLNSGTFVPNEIIIAIPKGFAELLDLQGENVRILVTKGKGQVSQRCEGFSIVKSEYVLQCDDDIILADNCLEELIKASQVMGHRSACASSLFFTHTNRSVYKRNIQGWLQKLYYALLNGKDGFREGVVTKAGTEIGVDIDLNSFESKIIPVEWVPGGIVLHRKDNLILKNFYPLTGKAYSEDLYHSYELNKIGVSLFVVENAKAWIDDPRVIKLPSFSLFFTNLKKDFLARKYYVKMTGRSLFRTYFFYLFMSASYLLKKAKF